MKFNSIMMAGFTDYDKSGDDILRCELKPGCNYHQHEGATSSQSSTPLSQVNDLLVGTLKLEDTEQAVTDDQAAQLLALASLPFS